MLVDYMRVSGIEVSNGLRFKSYMDNGLGGGVRVDAGCTTITYPDPGPYVLPHSTGNEAPWHDPARPESAHFAGLKIHQISGLDSPYGSRTMTSNVIGGSLGSLRLGPRQLVVRATLFALSTVGLDYGLEFVTSVLSGRYSDATTFCGLGDIDLFAGCPDPAQGSECGPGVDADSTVPVLDETTLDMSRTLFSAGLVDGPRVTNRMARGREVVAYEVSFTIGVESPYLAGALNTVAVDVDMDANAAIPAETWACPEYVDPCPHVDVTPISSTACVSYVEQTCDWNNGSSRGPSSWTTQTWTPTGEEVLSVDGDCSNMTLTRTGNAGVDGCDRPSVRMLFGDATGGSGPISIEFTNIEGQGNINFALWNPATDTNIPILSTTQPAGANASVTATPTGDSYTLSSTLSLGTHKIFFGLPDGVDPGNLYLIISAFGGGNPHLPRDETITNIQMGYLDIPPDPECCTLNPGVPIVAPVFDVPCWTTPATHHRTVNTVDNTDRAVEMGIAFGFTNPDATVDMENVRVAMYDPTLIGGTTEVPPTTAGVWPLGGVAEWECEALVHEFYLPEVPAGTTIEVDGRKRRSVFYPVGEPGKAQSAARYVYGGPEKPWSYQTVPPGKSYVVVVYADGANTPTLTQFTLSTAALHLIDGAAA